MNVNYLLNTKHYNKTQPASTSGWHNEKSSVQELIENIVQGHAFAPGIVVDDTHGKKSAKSEIFGAELFALDFDNEIVEVNGNQKNKRRLRDYEGYITYESITSNPDVTENALFAYKTPSHKDYHHKFRLVFLLPRMYKEKDYETIVTAFIEKYNSDPACKDISRFFFGNTEADYKYFGNRLNDDYIDKITSMYLPKIETDKKYQKNDITEQEVIEILSYIDKQPGYEVWRSILSAIANTYDLDTSIRIMEAWSPDTKQDRLKEKIISAQNANTKASLGTVIYYADLAGWDKNSFFKSRPKYVEEGEVLTEEERQKLPRASYNDVLNWLDQHYDIRYNQLLAEIEIKQKNRGVWKRAEDRIVRGILIRISQHYQVSETKLEQVIGSDYIKSYDPLIDYLERLPKWNPATDIDYISEAYDKIDFIHSDEINTKKQKLWFTKWLVGVVAGWSKQGINGLCMVFQGGQGEGKSTYIRNLVPPELKDYIYGGSIDPKSDDQKAYIGEKCIINLEEIETSTFKEIGHLKALITQDQVSVRKKYGRREIQLVRRASFCGSVNQMNFLNDPTGERRFLVFKVKTFENQGHIDLNPDGIYSQAKHLLENGFMYWLTRDEQVDVNQRNLEFKAANPENDAVSLYLEPVDVQNKSSEEIRKMADMRDIRLLKTNQILSEFKLVDNNNYNKNILVKALHSLGVQTAMLRYPEGNSSPQRFYAVRDTKLFKEKKDEAESRYS